jgi:hypothetical protein
MTSLSSTSLRSRFALLCGGLLALLALPATAQTPAATIEDDGGTVVLESYADGALLAPGTFGTGTIPTTGAGTRMMWHPAKAAFRAGRVFDNTAEFEGDDGRTYWDAGNIGDYSVALNKNTRASGEAATAMGEGTRASDLGATAMGEGTQATAPTATAMGDGAIASVFASTAMGFGTEANATTSTVMGRGTVTETPNSLSIGECNDANNVSATGSTLLAVGNGAYDQNTGSCISTSDALVLDDTGTLTVSSQNTFSDRRLKTKIDPLNDGVLRKLDEIRPVRYQFKNQETHPSGEQVGLIAQDVRKEFPEIVSEGAGGMLSLAYPKLTAVLLKGLQEQQTQIDRQRATIDSLKQRVRNIEEVQTRLARLEAQVQDRSVGAGVLGGGASTFGFGLLLGGLLGAGLLWRRRA